ncbi:hypothetical protein P1X14_00400 [Sphingomonas sp. AOB5]|uniref:hypothetical protein n=1 Tax=Sphingomonas sp. AOB5 TaxID=3034017 RepID=UPI0023FA31F0|nr:hypothetical protein [Sphingomonas sp. AOB5]MDF7773691.1 hypothetical protein [Sphingomonas sp. AOB5]
MTEEAVRLPREAPLPDEMQGRWVDIDEPEYEVLIEGGTIIGGGGEAVYEYKDVARKDGALMVDLGIHDQGITAQDSFSHAHVTHLVITPEREFFAYNVKFVLNLVRPEALV